MLGIAMGIVAAFTVGYLAGAAKPPRVVDEWSLVRVNLALGTISLRYSGIAMTEACDYNNTVSVFNGATVALNVTGNAYVSFGGGSPRDYYSGFGVSDVPAGQTVSQPFHTSWYLPQGDENLTDCPSLSLTLINYAISH